MTAHHHPEPKHKAGKESQPVKPGKDSKQTQNPQTVKPGLSAPPWQGSVSKKGADTPKTDSKRKEEEGTKSGMRQQGAMPLSGNVKK